MYQGKYTRPEAPKKPVETAPRPSEAPRQPNRAPARRKRRIKGSFLFYSIYIGMVALTLIVFLILMIPLHNWLVRFESSQPDRQRDQVFSILFDDPDWAVIYDLAKIPDTEFEGKSDYVRYMEAKLAAAENPKLTCAETSAGLSGNHKYNVKLDGETIATFTLVKCESEDPRIENWEMGSVEVPLTRTESVTVEKLPEYTVLINGVALGSNYTVHTVSTKAEAYLPDGVHGYRLERQYVSGLLVQPETVHVVDASGNDVPLVFHPETNTYSPDLPAPAEMTDEERQLALDAAKADALYAIRAISTGELRKHFDSNSQVYKDICDTATFIQSYSKYEFDQDVTDVTDFYRYNEELYSARVVLRMNITRKDGSIKSMDINTTYFLTRNNAGIYLVTNRTNESAQERTEQVRLTFLSGGEQVDTRFVDTDTASLMLPDVTAPEGKVLKGWAKQEVGENGKVTMTILFTPDAHGIAYVPEGALAEPLTLYAVFENKEAAAS